MRFRKKPVVIEAHQWFKNGDHPREDVVATKATLCATLGGLNPNTVANLCVLNVANHITITVSSILLKMGTEFALETGLSRE